MPTYEFRYTRDGGRTGGAMMITASSKDRAMDKFYARVGRDVEIKKMTVVSKAG